MSRFHIPAAAAAAAILAAPAAQAEPEEFAGIYAGTHVGYIHATADFDTGGDISDGGVIGGFQLGVNFLTGNVIWGVETDLSITDVDPDGGCPFLATASCSIDVEGVTTLRARLGYVVMDDLLFYVTGGAAAAPFRIASAGTSGMVPFTAKDDDGKFGWTAGAGVEYLVGSSPLPGEKNVGIKIEYRYMNFDTLDIDAVPGVGEQKIELDTHAIMAGINWHF